MATYRVIQTCNTHFPVQNLIKARRRVADAAGEEALGCSKVAVYDAKEALGEKT